MVKVGFRCLNYTQNGCFYTSTINFTEIKISKHLLNELKLDFHLNAEIFLLDVLLCLETFKLKCVNYVIDYNNYLLLYLKK